VDVPNKMCYIKEDENCFRENYEKAATLETEKMKE